MGEVNHRTAVSNTICKVIATLEFSHVVLISPSWTGSHPVDQARLLQVVPLVLKFLMCTNMPSL